MLSSRHDALNVSGIGMRARGEPNNKCNDNTQSPDHETDETYLSDDKAYNITHFLLQLMKKDSRFFQNNPSDTLPKFKSSEIFLEKNLGQGEFGVVFSIGAIIHNNNNNIAKVDDDEKPKNDRHSVSPENETTATDDETEMADDSLRHDHGPQDAPTKVEIYLDCRHGLKDTPPGLEQRDLDLLLEPNVSKGYMCKHAIRDGMPRYAIKRLKKDLKGDGLVQAMADLASEAHFLMTLRHPNICRMRGTVGEPGKRGFAIVIDRLTLTLRQKMAEWKKHDDRGSIVSNLKKVLGTESQSKVEAKLVVQKEIYGEKLLAAYDVARALRYLADHSIVFRDLKPENLAFDLRGDLRLFDFGLAKELKEKDMRAPGMYKMTGVTGSRRYMAPEVLMSKDYGLAVDIYSFAIMFWEMMANRNAYFYLGPEKHFETVVTRRKRPNIKKMISKKVAPQDSTICDLIEKAWSHDPRKRPGMEKVCDELFSEIMSASSEESSRVAVDRSTHLAAGSLKSRLDDPLWC